VVQTFSHAWALQNVDPPKWPDLRTQFFLSLRDQIFVLVPMCAVSLFILKPVGFSVAAADIPSLCVAKTCGLPARTWSYFVLFFV
jgi:hypothetical protein